MKIYPIHELANIVAMASEQEQLALTNDILKNGQEEPAVLWQGHIVDGRCRQLACISLDIELKTRTLSNELSLDEVASIVKSLNTRRNLTMTQKVVSAYKQQLRTNETNSNIANQWAISVPTLKNCKYIASNVPEFIEPLFDGKAVKLFNRTKGVEVTTNKINTLAKIIKDNKDVYDVRVDDSNEVRIKYSVDELPLSSPMYNWYGTKIAEFNRLSADGKELMVKALLFELAKYKEVRNIDY